MLSNQNNTLLNQGPDKHNHQQCIDTALARAQTLCQQQSLRLTKIREQVLCLIWQSHQPVGAYAIMESLAETQAKRVAPPTVYRALDFLLELGIIHRINSLNAFIGCQDPGHQHHSCFLICQSCKLAIEFDPGQLQSTVEELGRQSGFEIQSQNMELMGLCRNCKESQQ